MSDTTTSPRPLAVIPGKYATPPANLLSKLPKPTGRDNPKGHCTECGGYHGLPAVHLDYMGHADVTLALIEIDPTYDYGWVTDTDGAMLIRRVDSRLVLEGWLTVHGVKRLCVGTCQASKMEPEKELIGDLLRNGAMRFGVATALWSKSDGHESQDTDPAAKPRRTAPKTAQTMQPPPAATPRPTLNGSKPTKAQKALAGALFNGRGWKEDERLERTSELVGRRVESWDDLDSQEFSAMIDKLKALPA